MADLYTAVGKVIDGGSETGLDLIGQSLLKTARETVLALNKNQRCVNFVYFTDAHLSADGQKVQTDTVSAYHSLKMVSALAKERWADAVFFGGDMINAYESDFGMAAERMSEFAGALQDVKIPVYFCKGNHDDNVKVSDDDRFTNGVWSALTKQWQTGAVYNPDDPDGGYYYVDLPGDVRVFVWNQFHSAVGDDSATNWDDTNPGISGTQANWFKSVLDDSKTLVTIYHNPESGGTSAAVLAGNFAGSACIITGHTHADALSEGVVPHFTVARSYAIVGSTNSSHVIDSGADLYCVSVFTIDTVNKIVYETRIGRGESRQATYGV